MANRYSCAQIPHLSLSRYKTSTTAEWGKPVRHVDQTIPEKVGPRDLHEMRPIVGAKRRNEAIQSRTFRAEKQPGRTKVDQASRPLTR